MSRALVVVPGSHEIVDDAAHVFVFTSAGVELPYGKAAEDVETSTTGADASAPTFWSFAVNERMVDVAPHVFVRIQGTDVVAANGDDTYRWFTPPTLRYVYGMSGPVKEPTF